MSSTSSHRRLARAAAALVAAAVVAPLGLALPASAVRADDQPTSAATDDAKLQTFGIGPANRDGLDRRPAFVYSGRPGTVIRDRVALLNYTFKPLKVRVYANDAFTADGGAFDVLPAAEKPSGLGAWTNLKPRVITLPARSSRAGAPPSERVIPFRIKVPAKATPGDHAAGIVASTITDDAAAGATAGIVVDRRVGTRIYLRVAGQLEPRLEVKDLRASYVGTLNPVGRGRVEVTYRVENTGNVALSAAQRIRVDGALGTSSAAAPIPDLVQVLPGDDVTVTAVVDGVWPTVRVKAVVDLEPYAGSSDDRQSFPASSTAVSVWAIPWTLLLLMLLVGLATTYAVRNRRSSATDAEDPVDSEEAVLVP